jgi:hypothetical protein
MTVTSFTVGVVGTYYDYFSSVGTLKHMDRSSVLSVQVGGRYRVGGEMLPNTGSVTHDSLLK